MGKALLIIDAKDKPLALVKGHVIAWDRRMGYSIHYIDADIEDEVPRENGVTNLFRSRWDTKKKRLLSLSS